MPRLVFDITSRWVNLYGYDVPFQKMGHLFVYFQAFLKQTLHFYYKSIFSSSIRCWDSNPQFSVREAPPITTRPGRPSVLSIFFERPSHRNIFSCVDNLTSSCLSFLSVCSKCRDADDDAKHRLSHREVREHSQLVEGSLYG